MICTSSSFELKHLSKTIIQYGAVLVTFSRQMPNLMLKSSFATTAKAEPLTADRGLKFAVDFENAKLNVPFCCVWRWSCEDAINHFFRFRFVSVLASHAWNCCLFDMGPPVKSCVLVKLFLNMLQWCSVIYRETAVFVWNYASWKTRCWFSCCRCQI